MYEYLKNKSVALVGPARSLKNSGKGEYIDSHDFVVRLNHAKTDFAEDTGLRTDIVYYNGSPHHYESSKINYLVCSYPTTEWFYNERCLPNVNYYSKIFKHRTVDHHLYDDLKVSLDKGRKIRPNTGLVAIVDLLQSDLQKLYITGIDFHRTPYVSSYPVYGQMPLSEVIKEFNRGDQGDYHDTDAQFEYFKNEILKDKRVELSDFLGGCV